MIMNLLLNGFYELFALFMVQKREALVDRNLDKNSDTDRSRPRNEKESRIPSSIRV